MKEKIQTSYRGSECVPKDDNRIYKRGKLDGLLARSVLVSSYAEHFGYTNVVSGAKDIVRVCQALVHADATGEKPAIDTMLGMTFEELHDAVRNPRAELGLEPYYPGPDTDLMTAHINLLRTDIRSTELMFCDEDSSYAEAMQKILDALSAAAYILMLECRSERI